MIGENFSKEENAMFSDISADKLTKFLGHAREHAENLESSTDDFVDLFIGCFVVEFFRVAMALTNGEDGYGKVVTETLRDQLFENLDAAIKGNCVDELRRQMEEMN